MDQQQDATAGNEAVRHIKHREVHELRFDHIHHITQTQPVDHIAQTTAINGYNAPPFQSGKGHALLGKLPNDNAGKHNRHQSEQPDHTFKRGPGCTGIAHIG